MSEKEWESVEMNDRWISMNDWMGDYELIIILILFYKHFRMSDSNVLLLNTKIGVTIWLWHLDWFWGSILCSTQGQNWSAEESKLGTDMLKKKCFRRKSTYI